MSKTRVSKLVAKYEQEVRCESQHASAQSLYFAMLQKMAAEIIRLGDRLAEQKAEFDKISKSMRRED